MTEIPILKVSKPKIHWPDFNSKNSQNPNLDAIAHAIGRIVSEHTFLEEKINDFIKYTINIGDLSGYLSTKLNNSQKLEIIRLLSEHYTSFDKEFEGSIAVLSLIHI